MARGQATGKKGRTDNSEEPVCQIENESEFPANVIDGQDIQALAINRDELESIKQRLIETNKQMTSSSNKRSKKVRVRKEQLDFIDKKPKTKFLVTRKDLDTSGKIPKPKPIDFQNGLINENTILGTKEQLIHSAIKAGDLDEDSYLAQAILRKESQSRMESDAMDYQPFEPVERPHRLHVTRNETNALQNWRDKMIERKKHQGYISKFLQKPKEKLVSSGTESYRSRQETRELIDRAIPAIDYGKGYRVGSEFWRQYESIGDDLSGLKMSLKVSEKGKYTHLSRIGKPDLIKEEVGENYDPQATNNRCKSEYMENRRKELEPILTEFEAHQPNYEDLIVLGKHVRNNMSTSECSGNSEEPTPDKAKRTVSVQRDCNVILSSGSSYLSSDSSTSYDKIAGPAVMVKDATMTFQDGRDKVVDVFLYFDKFRGQMAIEQLRIKNIGQTTLYYNWSKVHHDKSFQFQRDDQTQRFYFNTSPGSILPGSERSFPFVFESPNAGKFSEVWKFMCLPALGTFRIILKGNSQSLQPEHDENKIKREEIEKLLEKQKALSAAKYVMNKILSDVKTPPRSHSPDYLYRTEEQDFELINPGFYYNYIHVRSLVDIWNARWPEIEWNFDLRSLREQLFTIEDFDVIEREQKKLNEICMSLKQKPFLFPSLSRYDHVRRNILDTIDRISEEMITMRRKLHISSTTPFPTENRPTSSQVSMLSLKGNSKDERAVKKSNSATKKEKSAGKGRNPGKDEKKKKKHSRTDVKSRKGDRVEEDPRSSSTQLSNYSDPDKTIIQLEPEMILPLIESPTADIEHDLGFCLNDSENSVLRNNYVEKMKSITKELLETAFDQIAAILAND